jgi:hypothetical protein
MQPLVDEAVAVVGKDDARREREQVVSLVPLLALRGR